MSIPGNELCAYASSCLGAPSFLDTCLVQFLLPGFEVNGRQHAVIRVLALRVSEHLDVVEHVLPCGFAVR